MEGVLEAQLMWRASRGTEARPRPTATAFTVLTMTSDPSDRMTRREIDDTSDNDSLVDDTAFVIFFVTEFGAKFERLHFPLLFKLQFSSISKQYCDKFTRYLPERGRFWWQRHVWKLHDFRIDVNMFLPSAFHLSFNSFIYNLSSFGGVKQSIWCRTYPCHSDPTTNHAAKSVKKAKKPKKSQKRQKPEAQKTKNDVEHGGH